ncbi:hypothetical protein UlMin_022979 [Ulmus minor]
MFQPSEPYLNSNPAAPHPPPACLLPATTLPPCFAFRPPQRAVVLLRGGETLVKACKPALESNYITKALYFQFGIKLNNVMDTQIVYSLIEEQEGRAQSLDAYISFVDLLADPRYCGISYLEKEEVRILLRQDPKFWTYRPLSEQIVRAAADDVRFLLYIYHKMMGKLTPRSLWHLAVRGALYCRCFRINTNGYADWHLSLNQPNLLGIFHILLYLLGIFDGTTKMTSILMKNSNGSHDPSQKACCILREIRTENILMRRHND